MTLHFIAFLLFFQTVCSEAFILKGNNIEKDKLHPAVKDLEDIEYQQAVLDPPIVINTFSEDIKSNCKSLREISRQSQLKVSSPSTKLTNKGIEKENVDGFSQSIEDSEKTIKADYKKGAEKASEFFSNDLNPENKPINIKKGKDLTDATNAKYNIRKDMNINNLSDSNESFNINLSMEQNGYQIEKPLPQSNGEISSSLIKINKTENINANKITFQSWEVDNNTEYSNITSLVLDVVDSAGLNINMTENNTTDHDFSSTEQHDNQINKLKQNSVDSSSSSRQVENILKKECFNSYKNNKDDVKNNQFSSTTTAGTISTEGEINLSRFHNNIMDINDIIRNENSLLISLQIEKPVTLKQSETSSRKKRGIEGIYIIENQSKKVNSAEDEDGIIIEDYTEFNEDSSYAPLYEESSFIDANCIKHDTKDL